MNGSSATADGLSQYWNRQQWASSLSRKKVTIRHIIECLGFKLAVSAAGSNKGMVKFDEPKVTRLAPGIEKLSETVPLDRDGLLDALSNRAYLEPGVDKLLEEHGPGIWGQHVNRSHLLTPRADSLYPKDLIFENADDKDMIRMHMHRWIGFKACHRHRNNRVSDVTEIDREPDTASDAEILGSHTLRQNEKVGRTARTATPTIRENGDSRPATAPAFQTPVAQILPRSLNPSTKRQNSGSQPSASKRAPKISGVQDTPSRVPNSSQPMDSSVNDRKLRRRKLADLIVRYLYRVGQEVNENFVLESLENELKRNEALYRTEMGNLYECQCEVLRTWIDMRRKITAMQTSTEDAAERFIAVNSLQVDYVVWESTRYGEELLTSDDLLCKAFSTVAIGVPKFFSDGLAKLSEREKGLLFSASAELGLDQDGFYS
ncbi:hypothetical protein K469DRAFT_755568 [Zopfia rhizophila CBS 207.26]|uniref:Uncharacterized protein n=1 Tax=Zopfia rhizophila CBS 207.26 TaxID=1314779 RepID=A0A6A6DGB2_9PEZI|nr:hypothetical protein K469DRAFT_755568 [Zopfia rhizophila CBS 207.26]